jgi:hypothetical protein
MVSVSWLGIGQTAELRCGLRLDRQRHSVGLNNAVGNGQDDTIKIVAGTMPLSRNWRLVLPRRIRWPWSVGFNAVAWAIAAMHAALTGSTRLQCST